MAQPLRQLERRSHRKSQVLTASARLFLEYGYHNVSVDDIAAAVGLTGPALYRHFRNKHDILEQALDEQMSAFEAVTSGVLTGGGPQEALLPRFLTEIGELVIAVDEALLWKRERRHLPPDERAEFRRRFRDLLAQTVDIVLAARPDLSRADAELFAWAVLSIHSNSREARGSLDAATVLRLLSGMAQAVVACDLTAVAAAPRRPPVTLDRRPVGRRERVLDAAVRLFAERGYHAVGIEDIAETSETAIVTVYQHFASKSDVLQTALTRGVEGLHYATAHRLAWAADDAQALGVIVETGVDLALGPHRRLLGILAADLLYLPREAQEVIRKAHREHVAEWTAALCAVRPTLPRSHARALTTTAIALIAEIAQSPVMRARPRIEAELRALARAVLRA
jgi:AcrR family transcriptional regulator